MPRTDSNARGIYKRRRHDGLYWAYRFQVNGNSYSGTTDLKAIERLLPEAKRVLAEHWDRVRRGHQEFGRRQRMRFVDAAEKFVEWSRSEHREHPATAHRHSTSLKCGAKLFGGLFLDEITAGDIEGFKTWRREDQIAEVSIRKDLLAIGQLFQFGMRHGWVDRNPVKEVKLPSDRDSINETTITPEEEALYFAEAARQSGVLHDVCRLMIWQGLRPTEALALTKDDVDLGRRILFVRQGKSRAARRELYLVPAAAALLEHRMARPYDFIFPGWRRCRRRWEHNGQAYTYSGLINAHKEVFAALNWETVVLEPFDMYSLRHTFATRFYEATKDLDKLARILGHGNLATVRRYVNPSQADLRAAMQIFEAATSQRTCVPATQQQEGEDETPATIH